MCLLYMQHAGLTTRSPMLETVQVGVELAGVMRETKFIGSQRGGRWPANLILTHAPGCGDECAPGCPVAALDAQSGILPVSRGGGNGYACSIFGTDTQKTRAKGVVGFGDTGGASRYFKQFTTPSGCKP